MIPLYQAVDMFDSIKNCNSGNINNLKKIYRSIGSCAECKHYITLYVSTDFEEKVCTKLGINEGSTFFCGHFKAVAG